MANMLERLRDAMNSHDAEQMASLFSERYESYQPLHPAQAFIGRDQVLANWRSVFEGVPNFTAELVASGYLVSEEPELGGWKLEERKELQGWAADRFSRA